MKKTLFLVAIAAMAFASCAKEGVNNESDTAILSFNRVISVGVVETRAYVATQEPFRVNVAAVAGSYVARNGVEFTYSSGWSTAAPIHLSSITTNITAWAPTGLTPSDVNTNPNVFALTPAAYAAANDLVYKTNIAVSSTNRTVSELQLDHAYAKVTVKFEGATYPGEGKFSSIVLRGTPGASTVDISNGTVTAASPVDLTVYNANSQLPAEGIEALVVPMTSPTVTLSCTLDDKAYTDLSVSAISTLAAGNNYIITLDAVGQELVITEVKIAEWNDVDGGTVILQ